MNRVDFEMPADVYHSDPCDTPALSASIAHLIVSECPMIAYAAHPRLGGHRRESTAAMDIGTVGHSMMLGVPDDRIVVAVDEDGECYRDFKTKRAQQIRDAIEAQGKVCVLDKQMAAVRIAVNAWKEQLDARGVRLEGNAEVNLFWEETASTGAKVQCRGRVDLLDVPLITDLKTCRSAKPRKVQRHLHDNGADVQAAAYESAIGKILPEYTGRTRYRWLFAETVHPYVIQPYVPAGSMRALGIAKWRQAIDIWEMCLRTGHWPGFSDDDIRIEAAKWAFEDVENFEEEEQQHGNAA